MSRSRAAGTCRRRRRKRSPARLDGARGGRRRSRGHPRHRRVGGDGVARGAAGDPSRRWSGRADRLDAPRNGVRGRWTPQPVRRAAGRGRAVGVRTWCVGVRERRAAPRPVGDQDARHRAGDVRLAGAWTARSGRRAAVRFSAPSPPPPPAMQAPMSGVVPILCSHWDADPDLVAWYLDGRADGLVIEATGAGNVNRGLAEGLLPRWSSAFRSSSPAAVSVVRRRRSTAVSAGSPPCTGPERSPRTVCPPGRRDWRSRSLWAMPSRHRRQRCSSDSSGRCGTAGRVEHRNASIRPRAGGSIRSPPRRAHRDAVSTQSTNDRAASPR